MSINTPLSDSLPLSIMKLDSSGLNWAIFSVCFQDAIEAKGFWGHFNGTSPHPSTISITLWDCDNITSKRCRPSSC
ncbi:hypothetical protein BYT27DRAFT_7095896 [Phlegmacium glaucopus]|nr:hypothetical protein BYT27DRAFT_7095896 [Phlegmacium glaucopus]